MEILAASAFHSPARLKSFYPINSVGSSLIDRPTLVRHYRCVFVRESEVRRRGNLVVADQKSSL